MIEVIPGDILKAKADIFVNPVNCVGVMGAGVAKAFKQRFPDMFEDYRNACKQGKVYIKIENYKIRYRPHVWIHPSREFIILNLPTKTHWKYPSIYEYIKAGLLWIQKNFYNLEKALGRRIETIAMPFIGCGLGGLDKNTVLRLIVKYLYDKVQPSFAL